MARQIAECHKRDIAVIVETRVVKVPSIAKLRLLYQDTKCSIGEYKSRSTPKNHKIKLRKLTPAIRSVLLAVQNHLASNVQLQVI